MALNYMDRPHRYTAGPAGRCLFCSHTQTWHATNRPRTPEEVAAEKLAEKIQQQSQDKADQAFMLTTVPTEEDLIAEAGKKMATEDKAAKIAGNALYDENDPMATAGLGGHKPPPGMDQDQTGMSQGQGAAGQGQGDMAMAAPMSKAQGFGGSDPDSGDAPLPGTVEADYANATVDQLKARKKAQNKPAASSSQPGSKPAPEDPNAAHAKPLPNEGPDPGGDPNYAPPLSQDPRNGLSDAQRQYHADRGEAMTDGSMPIRDDNAEADLATAQKVWGKHPDPHAARDHIIRRAQETGLTHTLHPTLQEHATSQSEPETPAEDTEEPTEEQTFGPPRQRGRFTAPVGKAKKTVYAEDNSRIANPDEYYSRVDYRPAQWLDPAGAAAYDRANPGDKRNPDGTRVAGSTYGRTAAAKKPTAPTSAFVATATKPYAEAHRKGEWTAEDEKKHPRVPKGTKTTSTTHAGEWTNKGGPSTPAGNAAFAAAAKNPATRQYLTAMHEAVADYQRTHKPPKGKVSSKQYLQAMHQAVVDYQQKHNFGEQATTTAIPKRIKRVSPKGGELVDYDPKSDIGPAAFYSDNTIFYDGNWYMDTLWGLDDPQKWAKTGLPSSEIRANVPNDGPPKLLLDTPKGQRVWSAFNGDQALQKSFRYGITKSTEDRYTFGPLYPAGTLDAHNEFTDARTLQKALWAYMDRTDRKINLQHQKGVTAGRLVEAVSWPENFTATLTTPGTVEKAAPVTFPAGTAYVGVVWEPWAWNLVKSGRLRGLSMGGSANRVQADLDVPEAVAKRFFSRAQRKTAAGSGAALPDGSFPIYNRQDLANARALANRARNPAKARAHIARRAAALGVAKALIEQGVLVKCSGGPSMPGLPNVPNIRRRKRRVRKDTEPAVAYHNTPAPVTKYRPDQPRIPHGPGGGRWRGIGPGGDTRHLASIALMPEIVETKVPGTRNVTRVRQRSVELGPSHERMSRLVAEAVRRRRQPLSSSHAGVYVGKAFAETGEPRPFG